MPHTFGYHHMFECPPVCWDAPICLDGPLYVWMPLCIRVSPMFGCPLYAWTTPICLDAPIYLDDVWMPPVHTQHKEIMLCQTKGVSICPHTCGCPLYINNTKKACFVRLRGCPYAPIHLDAPICLDGLLYVWMPLYFWMPPCMFGCPLYF